MSQQVVFALAGLVSFALVLTLVEQVILSLVQANVTTGTLGWVSFDATYLCCYTRVTPSGGHWLYVWTASYFMSKVELTHYE